mmetsp:Transcript_73130/g.174263  ORF Transcript_73130/g.174263 Transcript_73130/m.174263 type:complete len:263 (-) Transcript_73130:34-822(-)
MPGSSDVELQWKVDKAEEARRVMEASFDHRMKLVEGALSSIAEEHRRLFARYDALEDRVSAQESKAAASSLAAGSEDRSTSSTDKLSWHLEEITQNLLPRTETLEAKVEAIADMTEELRQQQTGPSEDEQSKKLDDLHKDMQALGEAVKTALTCSAQERSSRRLAADEAQVEAWPGKLHLDAEMKELRQRCAEVQQVVDERIMVSLWQVERELPEALEKVDQILAESAERFAKVEEHDVRLNLILSRLSTHEQRSQNCLERL